MLQKVKGNSQLITNAIFFSHTLWDKLTLYIKQKVWIPKELLKMWLYSQNSQPPVEDQFLVNIPQGEYWS